MVVRRFGFFICICAALVSSSCSRAPLNPPRLVVSSDTDMAIQLFMQATLLLSNYYGYTEIAYADVRTNARRAGLDSLPFMAPESVRATPELVNLFNKFENDPTQLALIVQRVGGYRNLVKYYIRTGLRASQSICRNYLLDLDEKSDYLDFIEKEVGVGYTLSTAVLALVHANSTLATSFLAARTGFDGALGAYQEYRYLSIDREAARAVVEAAQNKYAQYYMQQVDLTSTNPNLVTGGYTFSDALHAVSTIEYQCTRSGIKSLLARSINNSPANLMIDPVTGTIAFLTAASALPNPSILGGMPGADGNTGTPGTLIPPGVGNVAPPAGQPRGTSPRGPSSRQNPGGNVSANPGGNVSGNPGGQQPGGDNSALQQARAAHQACLSASNDPRLDACQRLPATPTSSQQKLCVFIKVNRNNSCNAESSFEGALPSMASKLPANIGLADVISGAGQNFEDARKNVIAGLPPS